MERPAQWPDTGLHIWDMGMYQRRPHVSLWACRHGDVGTLPRISDVDPEMLRYFASVAINRDSRVLILSRCKFAGILSVAIESANAAATTVELGSSTTRAIWGWLATLGR